MKAKLIPPVFFLALVSILPALPQNFEDLVSKYTEENGIGYTQPLGDALGATFNSGLFHSAHMQKLGFQMYLGLVTSGAFFSEKRETFTATTEGNFTPIKTAEVPTVVGPAESVEVNGDGGTVYVFPAGMNVRMLPFAIPQLTIGSVYGTDVTFRYFAYSFDEDVGDLDLFSWGIRHSVSQYFSTLPLDLAVGLYNQRLRIGDILDCNSWFVVAQASKKIKIFTFYGGLGYENAKSDLEYTYEAEDTEVAFQLKGSNNIRFTAGVTFNLGPVKLNVDYSLASQSVLSAGLGIGIGE